MNNLNKNLLFLLKAFAATQSELAAYAGVSQNSISNWINEVSFPNAAVLIKIHQFFGVSIDALLLSDIEKEKIVTESHVNEFKRLRKPQKEVPGKIKQTSKEYFVPDDIIANQVGEPDAAANWAIMSQLQHIQRKLEELKSSIEQIKK